MFRVGGYQKSYVAEDYNLFERMLATGRKAVHVSYPLIEYRKHSHNQANNVVVYQTRAAKFFQEMKKYNQAALDLSQQNMKLFSLIYSYQKVRSFLMIYYVEI